MGLHDLKSFFRTKEMVFKLKRPSTEWEKIFPSHTSNKGLITRIYRELQKLNSQKLMTQEKKEQQNIFKGKSPNGQKTHGKMLTIPGHKGNANQTTLRFHLTPVIE
jgi:hypothetical protein